MRGRIILPMLEKLEPHISVTFPIITAQLKQHTILKRQIISEGPLVSIMTFKSTFLKKEITRAEFFSLVMKAS